MEKGKLLKQVFQNCISSLYCQFCLCCPLQINVCSQQVMCLVPGDNKLNFFYQFQSGLKSNNTLLLQPLQGFLVTPAMLSDLPGSMVVSPQQVVFTATYLFFLRDSLINHKCLIRNCTKLVTSTLKKYNWHSFTSLFKYVHIKSHNINELMEVKGIKC